MHCTGGRQGDPNRKTALPECVSSLLKRSSERITGHSERAPTDYSRADAANEGCPDDELAELGRMLSSCLILRGDLFRVVDDQELDGGLLGFQFETELVLQSSLPDGERVAACIWFDIQADVVDPLDPGFVYHRYGSAARVRGSFRIVQQRYGQLHGQLSGELGHFSVKSPVPGTIVE